MIDSFSHPILVLGLFILMIGIGIQAFNNINKRDHSYTPPSWKRNILYMTIFLVGFSISLFVFDMNAFGNKEMIALPEKCNALSLNMIQCPILEDVSMDDAATSMKLRANILNFKMVAHMPLSQQVKEMGGESKRMEIFQFCDALIAAKMVEHSPVFAGYLPCRIAMIEDREGMAWLITMNMDTLMQESKLPNELMESATLVRNNIYNILTAGIEGDL